MKKKNYFKATVEVIEFRAENGFANTYKAVAEQYKDGGTISGFSSNEEDNPGISSGWDF